MFENLTEFLFGKRAPSHLPNRVYQSIDEQQAQSERLISWVQLLLVSFFGILYAIAPKPPAQMDIQPVPWILSIYLGFTLIRLLIATRGRLPEWLLSISLAMDMSLLMVLIWSFHIQYDQPPAFYLKAPTMVYVFIFIALRTLRFDPRHILLAGMAAAIGWGALVIYVIANDNGMMVVTRDYIKYMTSNAILVGAEIDKIISIMMVTVILAVAVARAKRVFERNVFDSMAAQDLSRFVSPEIADRITHADEEITRGDSEEKFCTVMFTDIEGFSTVAEKVSALELSNMLNDYFDAMSEIISRHGGVITQYQGDLMLITFNAVTPNDNHAVNAVQTAIEIQEATRDRLFGPGHPLRTRCGINSGEIAIGAIGAQDRLVFTVHGDDVNVAARLEGLNKEYGSYILVGQNTVKACGTAFPFREMGEVTVRGRSGETGIFGLEQD